MRYVLVAIGLSFLANTAPAQATSGGEQHAIIALPGKMTWSPAPPILLMTRVLQMRRPQPHGNTPRPARAGTQTRI